LFCHALGKDERLKSFRGGGRRGFDLLFRGGLGGFSGGGLGTHLLLGRFGFGFGFGLGCGWRRKWLHNFLGLGTELGQLAGESPGGRLLMFVGVAPAGKDEEATVADELVHDFGTFGGEHPGNPVGGLVALLKVGSCDKNRGLFAFHGRRVVEPSGERGSGLAGIYSGTHNDQFVGFVGGGVADAFGLGAQLICENAGDLAGVACEGTIDYGGCHKSGSEG